MNTGDNPYERYKVSIPAGSSGDWRVEQFVVTAEGAKFHNLREALNPGRGYRVIYPGTHTKLCRGGEIIMSDTPSEVSDILDPIREAKGQVLINGLGLGVVLQAVLAKPEVDHVTVVELSPDVVRLVAPIFFGGSLPVTETVKRGRDHAFQMRRPDGRLTLVHDDAFEYDPPKGVRYGMVWHDIWDGICSDNLVQMTRLKRKYGRRADWQGCWCEHLCRQQERRGGCW